MSGVALHVCAARDEDGGELVPDMATCGTCARSWCARCQPTPVDLCPGCNGDTFRAPIPPRQYRAIERLRRERRAATVSARR